jgi:demethylmenaquinone methyltransferase/2-methoxy-6-polyprenyl-1,4-benzoquinol methylase
MAEALTVQKMFSDIAPRYDLVNSVLSFGVHHYWRKVLVRLLPPSKDKIVLDLCTGTGDLLPILTKRFGKVMGADFCLPMLERAGKKLKSCPETKLIQADALNLPFNDESFDIVSVAFGVRNFENLERGLKEIHRVLKPGGSALILEFGQPGGIFFGPLYNFYSKFVMPNVGGLISGNKVAYEYLPETAKKFPCAENFNSILKSCRFSDTVYKSLTGGIAYCYSAKKESNE